MVDINHVRNIHKVCIRTWLKMGSDLRHRMVGKGAPPMAKYEQIGPQDDTNMKLSRGRPSADPARRASTAGTHQRLMQW